MSKTVSVIVPAYNAEKTIERCIDSLVKQTFKPAEIIIIDDGSTDHTGIILDQYADKYNFIKVIHQINSGVSAARNRGIDEAASQFLLFVDSDDEVGEQFVDTLMKYSDYDFVTCGFHLQNPMLSWEDIEFTDECQNMDVIRQHPSKYMGKYYFGSPWAKLYLMPLVERLGLRFSTDIHNGEDTLFNFQYMFTARTIRIVPLCDYYYYYQNTSLSRSSHSDNWRWRLIQENMIKNFFICSSMDEVLFLRQREFGVLRQLLGENGKSWSKEQIRNFYAEPIFQQCIQHQRKNGSFEDRFLIFVLDHNHYQVFACYLLVKKYIRRGINHFRRKLSNHV